MSLRDFGPNELMFLLLAARWTILLALIAFAGGGLVGLVIAATRVSPVPPLRWLAMGYTQFFMGTPILIQLFMAYYGSSLLGFRPGPWVAAALTFSFNGGAFFAEIFRGSIESVPKGQWEASTALGFRFLATLRLVILPQAIRRVLPALGNDFIAMLKDSSLVSVLGVSDITQLAKLYASSTFLFFQTYSLLGLIYLTLTITLSRGVRWLEVRLSQDRR